MRRLFCLCGLVLGGMLTAAQEKPTPAPAPTLRSMEIFDFFTLLSKSERILTAEVGAESNGFVTLKDVQYVKKPAQADIPPEVSKRANELLDELVKEKPGVKEMKSGTAVKSGAIPVRLGVGPGAKLPPQGTQALFFLWERIEDGPNGEITYKLSHPQNIYDIELLPQVKVAVDRPRSVADGRFLRDWDKAMFQRATQRRADANLLQAEGGNTDKGISIKAARPALALRQDNSFNVAAVIENNIEREQMVYDGPAGGFGARLRKKDGPADSGIILRLSTKNVVGSLDASVLEITDVTDFSTIKASGSMSKELFFDAAQFPQLKSLSGEYVLNVFYASQRDGGDSLEKAAWTGTVMSRDVTLKFEQRADK